MLDSQFFPHSHTATLVTCALNQFALDFHGNYQRILNSVKKAKENGATFRTGPELEITGYGCHDHFLEEETYIVAWQILLKLLLDPMLKDILCDFGMPVRYQSQNYNCRVIVLNQKILLIRPKKILANEGHYTEQRWFTPWPSYSTVSMTLPNFIQSATGQVETCFGDAVLDCLDLSIGFEMCEELWQSHNEYCTNIIVNGSASYFETGKLALRSTLVKSASLKCKGVYMYSNMIGGENRVYYDGGPMVYQNGELVGLGEVCTLSQEDILIVHVDRTKLTSKFNHTTTSVCENKQVRIPVLFQLSSPNLTQLGSKKGLPSTPLELVEKNKETEWMMAVTGWLWDYLVKTKSTGFVLPLSGGLDSCSVAIFVYYLCIRLESYQHVPDIQAQLQLLYPRLSPPYTRSALIQEMLTTVYLATRFSSEETQNRALLLSNLLNSFHYTVNLEPVIQAWSTVTKTSLQCEPKGLALENVQARSRMVASYLFAQILSQSEQQGKRLLVLSSANLDETLFGYYTKYDCASADLNPIGSLTKSDIRCFVHFAMNNLKLPWLQEFLSAAPSAELSNSQTDEADMGLTYATLSDLAHLRQHAGGPMSLLHYAKEKSDIPLDQTEKFLRHFLRHRHKAIVLTPSCHLQPFSTDVFFERRPFMYPSLDQIRMWNPEECNHRHSSISNGNKSEIRYA